MRALQNLPPPKSLEETRAEKRARFDAAAAFLTTKIGDASLGGHVQKLWHNPSDLYPSSIVANTNIPLAELWKASDSDDPRPITAWPGAQLTFAIAKLLEDGGFGDVLNKKSLRSSIAVLEAGNTHAPV